MRSKAVFDGLNRLLSKMFRYATFTFSFVQLEGLLNA